MCVMNELTTFLQKQKILQIAPSGDPWIANVFMGSESPEKIYFIGSPHTRYGQQLQENKALAFATAWHEEENHLNRKGIQGVGEAVLTQNETEIETGVRLHNQNYPEFKERITVEWVKENERGSGVWVITPHYIKFWNDGLYGQDGSKEFQFDLR